MVTGTLHETFTKGLIKEQTENNESFMKKTLIDLGVVVDGTFTFGTGITAFLPTVRELLRGGSPNITEQEIILIYITAMWILLSRNKDKIERSLSIIKEKGLTGLLSKVFDFLKSTEDIVVKMANEVGYTASSLVDITAFTFMTFPVLDVLIGLINDGTINVSDPAGYLKSVLISVGLLSVKNGFNSIIKSIKRKYGKLNEDKKRLRNLLESKEDKFYDQLTTQMVKDIMSSIKKTMTQSESEMIYLPEDMSGEITYNDTTINLELTISRNDQLEEDFLVEAYYSPDDDTIELGLEINPLKEPGSYQKIYSFLIEYVRHELVHHEQNERGELPSDDEKGLSNLDYYLQPHEIPAQIKGLDLRAKKMNQNYKDVVKKSIEFSKQRYGLSDGDGVILYNKLMDGIENQLSKTNLNEQTNQLKSFNAERVLVDNEKYKIVAPLSPERMCYYAENTPWCTDNSFDVKNAIFGSIQRYWLTDIGPGNFYVVIEKNTSNKFVVGVKSKIPLLRTGGETILYWGKNDQVSNSWEKVYSELSDYPELQKFFNLEYDLKRRLKYNMKFADEELQNYAKKGGNLSKVLYNIYTSKNEEEVEDLLEPYLGDTVDFTYSSYQTPDWDSTKVLVTPDLAGLNFQVPTQIFEQEWLNDEDGAWVLSHVFGDYSYYDSEEVDEEELNYIWCYVKDSLWDELLKFIMEELPKEIIKDSGIDFSSEKCNGYDDGELNDFLQDTFPVAYENFQGDILAALGYAIGSNRAKEAKSWFIEESSVPIERSNGGSYDFFLSWEHLLVLVAQNNMKTLSELAETGTFELSSSLNDVWWDSWGVDEEYQSEIDEPMVDFLADIKTKLENTGVISNNKNFREIVLKLGFEKNSGWSGWQDQVGYKSLDVFEEGTLKKKIHLHKWSPSTNQLTIMISSPSSNTSEKYIISPDELSDYVVSNQLDFSEN